VAIELEWSWQLPLAALVCVAATWAVARLIAVALDPPARRRVEPAPG
jgi:hypothetical protein